MKSHLLDLLECTHQYLLAFFSVSTLGLNRVISVPTDTLDHFFQAPIIRGTIALVNRATWPIGSVYSSGNSHRHVIYKT